MSMANFTLEDEQQGLVCGIDEVGRGPLAGPVVAACVIIPVEIRNAEFINYIQDSKKLTEIKRKNLFQDIQKHCHVGLGQCSPQEIDELNILWATMEAMKRALADMSRKSGVMPDFALVDGNRLPPDMPCPAMAVVKGDGKSKSIAAASIIAKVTRDEFMTKIAADYPHYGWESNSAYPAPKHLAAIKTHGITDHHRKSFGPVKKYLTENF